MKSILLFCTLSFLPVYSMKQDSDLHVYFHNTKTNKIEPFVRIKSVPVVKDNKGNDIWFIPLQNLFANPQGMYSDINFSQVRNAIKKSGIHDTLKCSMLSLFEPIELFQSLLSNKNRHIAYYEIMHEFEYLIYQMIRDKIINNKLESMHNTVPFMTKNYYLYFLSKVQKSLTKAYNNEIGFYQKLISGSSLITLVGMIMPCPLNESYETEFTVVSCNLLFFEVCFYYNFYHKYNGCMQAINELKGEKQ